MKMLLGRRSQTFNPTAVQIQAQYIENNIVNDRWSHGNDLKAQRKHMSQNCYEDTWDYVVIYRRNETGTSRIGQN